MPPSSRFISGGVSTVTVVPNPPVATFKKVRSPTSPTSIGAAEALTISCKAASGSSGMPVESQSRLPCPVEETPVILLRQHPRPRAA